MTWFELEKKIIEQNGYLPTFHPKALEEFKMVFQRDRSLGMTIISALFKLSKNPLPQEMGGLGLRLWKQENPLTLRPLLYVKLKVEGIRIVYALTQPSGDSNQKTAKSFFILGIN